MHLGWFSADRQVCQVQDSCRFSTFVLVCALLKGAATFEQGVRSKIVSVFESQISICRSKDHVLCRRTQLKLENRCVF